MIDIEKIKISTSRWKIFQNNVHRNDRVYLKYTNTKNDLQGHNQKFIFENNKQKLSSYCQSDLNNIFNKALT